MNFFTPTSKNKKAFNDQATHPLQSWQWGEFRKETGVIVERIFNNKLSFQITFHKIPYTSYTIGYLPRSQMPTKTALKELKKLGKKHNAIFIKLEPNIFTPVNLTKSTSSSKSLNKNIYKKGKPLFTNHSFQIDLTKSTKNLLKQMKPKTRYNIRIAQKNNVKIKLDNSPATFKNYLKLLKQTTKRQQFFAHSTSYHQKMYNHMKKANIAHILKATYKKEVLATWILFVFNQTLYYPYGASSNKYRQVMASNLIMWEAIKFGKKIGCKTFDMWGSLGKNPNKKNPWYGFHRFKAGYGGTLVEFIGSFDLILKPTIYPLYRLTETIRWLLLRFIAKTKNK